MVGRNNSRWQGIKKMKSEQYAEGLCQFCFEPMPLEYNIYGDVVFASAEISMRDGSFFHVCPTCFEDISALALKRFEEGRLQDWAPKIGVILSDEYLKSMRDEVIQ